MFMTFFVTPIYEKPFRFYDVVESLRDSILVETFSLDVYMKLLMKGTDMGRTHLQ